MSKNQIRTSSPYHQKRSLVVLESDHGERQIARRYPHTTRFPRSVSCASQNLERTCHRSQTVPENRGVKLWQNCLKQRVNVRFQILFQFIRFVDQNIIDGHKGRSSKITIRRLARCLCIFLLAFAGCDGSNLTTQKPGDVNDQPETTEAEPTEIERGPVKVSIQVEPQPARLSDELTMTLTIDCVREVQIHKPPFGEAFGDFIIRDFREPLPETRDDREIIRQIYTLEPTQTGKLQIAPIIVAFTDSRHEGDGEKHTIETEAITVEIASVLQSEAPSLDDLQGLDGPLQMPPGRSYLARWLFGLLLLVWAAALTVWFLRGRRGIVEEKRLTPREFAFLELQELVRDNLGETDIKLFYVRLTGIVRRYIERTTHIHAPEQTTEEFLREVNTGNVFQRNDQQRLKSFLESADFVKFAAHQPTADDVEQAFERAKIFVGLENDHPVPTGTEIEVH